VPDHLRTLSVKHALLHDAALRRAYIRRALRVRDERGILAQREIEKIDFGGGDRLAVAGGGD
jgi:hypothetical protein